MQLPSSPGDTESNVQLYTSSNGEDVQRLSSTGEDNIQIPTSPVDVDDDDDYDQLPSSPSDDDIQLPTSPGDDDLAVGFDIEQTLLMNGEEDVHDSGMDAGLASDSEDEAIDNDGGDNDLIVLDPDHVSLWVY